MHFNIFKTTAKSNIITNNKSKNKTIKQKESGLIAKGKHGAAYDLGYKNNILQFNILDKELPNIKSIKLYGFKKNNTLTISNGDDITKFNIFLNNMENKIVKIIKTDSFYNKEKIIEKDFTEEINLNRQVINIYGKNSNNFLTVKYIGVFKNIELIGAVITLINNTKMHLIFGHKCNNVFKPNIKPLLIDILESLAILQKNDYQHDDVKMDNIVKCSDKYKLIDWGKMRNINRITIRTIFGLNHSPIFLYIYKGNTNGSAYSILPGLPVYSSFILEKLLIKYNDKNLKWMHEMLDFPLLQETLMRVGLELKQVISTNPNQKDLLEKYKYTGDIYMLGIALIYAIFKYKINITKYKVIIERFTSLVNPLKDAKDALKWVKSVL